MEIFQHQSTQALSKISNIKNILQENEQWL